MADQNTSELIEELKRERDVYKDALEIQTEQYRKTAKDLLNLQEFWKGYVSPNGDGLVDGFIQLRSDLEEAIAASDQWANIAKAYMQCVDQRDRIIQGFINRIRDTRASAVYADFGPADPEQPNAPGEVVFAVRATDLDALLEIPEEDKLPKGAAL